MTVRPLDLCPVEVTGAIRRELPPKVEICPTKKVLKLPSFEELTTPIFSAETISSEAVSSKMSEAVLILHGGASTPEEFSSHTVESTPIKKFFIRTRHRHEELATPPPITSIRKIYTEESEEVASFCRAFFSSRFIRQLYKGEDISFLKQVVLPTLLHARDEIIQQKKREESPCEYVITTKKYPAYPGYEMEFDLSSLPEESVFKATHEAGEAISCKLKADGTFVFSIPSYRLRGSTKKAVLKILSSLAHPHVFHKMVKISVNTEKRESARVLNEVATEFERSIFLIADRTQYPIVKLLCKEGKPFKAYAKERIDVSTYLKLITQASDRTPESAYSFLMTILTICIQMTEQLYELHKKHVIHNDVKPQNFLVQENPISRRINLLLWDFGLSTFDDASSVTSARYFGTDGYFIPGAPHSYAKDKFALGKTFENILFKVEHVTRFAFRHQNPRSRLYHELFQEIKAGIKLISEGLTANKYNILAVSPEAGSAYRITQLDYANQDISLGPSGDVQKRLLSMQQNLFRSFHAVEDLRLHDVYYTLLEKLLGSVLDVKTLSEAESTLLRARFLFRDAVFDSANQDLLFDQLKRKLNETLLRKIKRIVVENDKRIDDRVGCCFTLHASGSRELKRYFDRIKPFLRERFESVENFRRYDFKSLEVQIYKAVKHSAIEQACILNIVSADLCIISEGNKLKIIDNSTPELKDLDILLPATTD
jgi:serine/threonine protein kinase